MAAISAASGSRRAVGEVEEVRLRSERRRGGRGLGAPDAAELLRRLAPAGGAVGGDGERDLRPHRAPGEERAADEDFEIVRVGAEREDPH